MTPETIQAAVAALHRFEGMIAWPYSDTAGVVTAGIGHALESQEAMCALPWKVGAADATLLQMQTDYQALLAEATANPGKPATHFEALTVCRLLPADIDGLCALDLQAVATGLERYFPQIDLWPDPAILGALDMGYNLGPNFPPKWPAFTAAAQAKDWATCAVQSHRAPPISNERNSYVFNLFTQAAQGMPST